MKKLLISILLICVSVSIALAVPGEIHLLYSNGQIIEDNGVTYYEFDVQAYLSQGQEVLGAGMAYVEYPINIFGESVISNGSVIVEKTGILDGEIPGIAIDLYDWYENDSYTDMFALSFETPFAGNMNMIGFFSEISTDPQNPSDLLNIKMEVIDYGIGSVVFPPSIPGELFFNFDWETFDEGLNISEANEQVVYENTSSGDVSFTDYTANWVRRRLRLKWVTEYESNLEGFVIKRSESGGEYQTISSYLTNPALEATNGNSVVVYWYYDNTANYYTPYKYRVEAVDAAGNVFSTNHISVFGSFIAYPNPFNPSFVVPFELMEAKEINIRLYDMSGRLVRDVANGTHGAGSYEYRVNCDDLASGIYILRTVVDDMASTQKMLLVK